MHLAIVGSFHPARISLFRESGPRPPEFFAIDTLRTYYPGSAEPLKITRLYEEGAFVPDQMAIFTYTGSFAALVELETLILQRIGVACVSAYNAYKMAMHLKK